MKAFCPECNAVISPAQMNVETDVAVCTECGAVIELSSIASTQKISSSFDINDPPRGAWFDDDFQSWKIGATTRSQKAFILVPYAMVYSVVSLSALYGSQIINWEFSLFRSLFGIIFIIGSLSSGIKAIMAGYGRVDVIVDGRDGKIFYGAGPIGRTRKFDWYEVTSIEEVVLSDKNSRDENKEVISLEGKSRLRFGSELSQERRYYLLQGLRVLQRR